MHVSKRLPPNQDRIEQIKTLALMAMFSDDLLVDRLVLKGGNALALAYGVTARVSADLDFSMPDSFTPTERVGIETRIQRALDSTFKPHDLIPFDVLFSEKPPEISDDMKDFWGGYNITFKIIGQELHARLKGDLYAMRRQADIASPGDRKSLEIDISRHEVCQPKQEFRLSNYTISVYTPELCVFEKLRAICQQMPEYDKVVKRNRTARTARPRDFFDIHSVMTKKELRVDLDKPGYVQLLQSVFEAKHVEINWLLRIGETFDQHVAGWDAVRDTVRSSHELKDFRFYFDYVVELAARLHPRRDV